MNPVIIKNDVVEVRPVTNRDLEIGTVVLVHMVLQDTVDGWRAARVEGNGKMSGSPDVEGAMLRFDAIRPVVYLINDILRVDGVERVFYRNWINHDQLSVSDARDIDIKVPARLPSLKMMARPGFVRRMNRNHFGEYYRSVDGDIRGDVAGIVVPEWRDYYREVMK